MEGIIAAGIVIGCSLIGICINRLADRVADHALAVRGLELTAREAMYKQFGQPTVSMAHRPTNIALQQYTNSAGREAQGGAR